MFIRECVLLPLAACILATVTYAQDATRFIGKWKGEYAGKAYFEMTIEDGAPPKITISTAVVHFNKDGVIAGVDGKVEHPEKVLESKLVEGQLKIKSKQQNEGTVEYLMKLESDNVASLAITTVPKIKPFRLKRS
jgi:hypothetical protein